MAPPAQVRFPTKAGKPMQPRIGDSGASDDADHFSALASTGFFGRQAAGCIPVAADTGRAMLVLRSGLVQEPFTWGTVGGAHHSWEPAEDAVRRELIEETGYDGPAEMLPLFVFRSGSFSYSNFVAVVECEFVPELGWEAVDHSWRHLGDFPLPLHFGIKALLNDEPGMAVLSRIAFARRST